MGHEGTLVRKLPKNNHIPLPSGGVGRYQAVYLGRDELTRSFCQHLVLYLIPRFSDMFTSITLFGRCILDCGGHRLLNAHTTNTLVQLFSQGWHLHFTFPAEIFQIAKVHWKRLESQHSTRRKLTNLGQCQGPLSSYIPTNILQCTQPFAINLYSTWWDPKGVCRPLHSMNRLRVPLVREGLLQVSYGT